MQQRVSRLSIRSLPSTASGVLELLRTAGMRPTAARVYVLLTLEMAEGPMAAEEVFRALSLQGINVGLGTAYRALAELAAIGLLERAWVQGHAGAKAVYSIKGTVCVASAGTHRLTCGRCGHSVVFIDAGLSEHLSQVVSLQEMKGLQQSLTITVGCIGCSPQCSAETQRSPCRNDRERKHLHAD